MTRGVLFDFYGTLARAVSWGDTHEQVFSRHGIQYDEAAWTDRWVGGALDGEEHAEHSRSPEHYRAWELDRLRQRSRSAGVGEDDLEALVADLYAVSKDYMLAAYNEVPDVLGELRRRGVKVAVCSNWDWHIDRAVTAAGLSGLADVVVTSAQAGARKPHPRIFHHTLDRCGLAPAEVLFVGDTWGPDVAGPLALGMRAAHLRRPDHRHEGDGLPALPEGASRIADLRAVLDLV
ncbi:MAG: HAD family hydrolase [Acidimicrobiales bacterium]